MSKKEEPAKTIDTSGEVCPFPWIRAKKALTKLKTGQLLKVVGDYGAALHNIPCHCEDEGQTVVKAESTGPVEWEIVIRKEK